MKHRKLLSMLLALVMVLSLAPSAVFAGDIGRMWDLVQTPYQFYLFPNVHVQNVRKVWQYADGQEIPADELAALVEQGVIPASVDIFYMLRSSDDGQTGFFLPEKYYPVLDEKALELNPWYAPGRYPNCYHAISILEEGDILGIDAASALEILEEQGWNASGWIESHINPNGKSGFEFNPEDFDPEDIGGMSRQTLSQENGWATGFDEAETNLRLGAWDDNGGSELLTFIKTFNLHLTGANHLFMPVAEHLPDGYPLVSMTEGPDTEELLSNLDDLKNRRRDWAGEPFFFVSDLPDFSNWFGRTVYEAARQAWMDAGEVVSEKTYTNHADFYWVDTKDHSLIVEDDYTFDHDLTFHVSKKAYGDGWFYQIVETRRHTGSEDGAYLDHEFTYYYVVYPAVFTNTYNGERPWKDITVTKTWDDGAASFRPESITVNLLANGEPVASQTVTADDGWVCTFEKMPVYSEGTEIVYTVTEDAVPGYETTVDGFEITNTCTSGTLQIVKKSEGAQTPDGTRFTISGTPEADGVTFETRTVRYADFENGVYTLENVPAGTYTVTENQNDATLAGYELTVSGNGATKTLLRGDTVKFVITNKYERTTEVIPVNPTPTPAPAPALNTEDHYAYIIGYPDGLVRPNGTITRAEVVTVFFRMLTDASRDAIWSTENSFTDVQLNEWFNNAISTIENGGIINGYPDGSFNPNGNITRAEFAAMAIRFFQDAKVGPSKFSDTIGHWAAEAISKAQNEGLIMGYPDGTFHPDQPITRAEAMTIFNRVLKRAPHKDHLVANMIQWPDNMNKSVWYYADVQEATNSHTYTMSDTTTSAHEIWQKLLPVRDWEAFEKAWSTAHSASNPGEVVNN